MPPAVKRRAPQGRKSASAPPVARSHKGAGAMLGRGASAARAAARQKMREHLFQNRLLRLLERMNLHKVVQPVELTAARDLGMYLLMTPREVAETMHKIYSDRRRRADFQRRMMAYPQIRQDQDQFHQLAGYFAGIAFQTGVVRMKK